VADVIAQLAGFEVPAAAWEGSVLPARVRGYKREWLDQLTLSGEVTWARLWGSGTVSVRRAPVCLVMREDLDSWTGLAALAAQPAAREPGAEAQAVSEALAARGPMFLQELTRAAGLLPVQVENGLGDLIGLGRVTCDSFAGLRWMIVPSWRRRPGGYPAGRWSLVARASASLPSAEFVARRLLRRTGVIFRKTLAREKQPLPWRDIARACRTLEARGEIRGGRFVAAFDGEQYALPEAIPLLRAVRRRGQSPADPVPVMVSAADPLNFRGILTPDDRIAPATRTQVRVA
jgi:ATP-dependent Lhr-like helicase